MSWQLPRLHRQRIISWQLLRLLRQRIMPWQILGPHKQCTMSQNAMGLSRLHVQQPSSLCLKAPPSWLVVMRAAHAAQERSEFDEPDYALIDTLFSLAEAHLFMQLVELQDAEPHALPAGKATADLYKCGSAQRALGPSAANTCLLRGLSFLVLDVDLMRCQPAHEAARRQANELSAARSCCLPTWDAAWLLATSAFTPTANRTPGSSRNAES